MKGLLLNDPKTGSNLLIDVPELMPEYALGTTVIARVLAENDTFTTIEGDVIGVEIQEDMDKDGAVSTMIGYRIIEHETEEIYHVMEDDIEEYYPHTNEYDIAYHTDNEDERD